MIAGRIDPAKTTVLAFSGGGVKALYGLGWLESARDRGLSFERLYAASAGASLSLAFKAGVGPEVVADFERLAASHRAVDWKSLLSGGPASGFETAHRALLERWVDLPAALADPAQLSIVALALPESERRLRPLHVVAQSFGLVRDIRTGDKAFRARSRARKLGLEPHIWRLDEIASPADLRLAVEASSSLPPAVGVSPEAAPWIDGGLVHPAPVDIALAENPGARVAAICYSRSVCAYLAAALEADGADASRVDWIYPEGGLRAGVLAFGCAESIRDAYERGRSDGAAHPIGSPA